MTLKENPVKADSQINGDHQHLGLGLEKPETNGNSTNHTTGSTGFEGIHIIGAGPVGLLLALRLAQRNIPTLILEMEGQLNQAPRAIGYFGPTHQVFREAGIYDTVARDGMQVGGFAWRGPLVDDGSGGKLLGPIIASNLMSAPDENGTWPIERHTIQLAQDKLAAILLQELEKTGQSRVLWHHKVVGLTQDEAGVQLSVDTPEGLKEFKASYAVGADGGKSAVRKLLSVRLGGHSWPERFVATDIVRTTGELSKFPIHFTIDPSRWAVITPLERVTKGERNLWRYSMAVTDTSISDEEVLSDEYIDKLLLQQIDGPRPSDHIVKRRSLYKMHQLLASTMNQGRCFLIGDAAHINNPIGGLGLTTGLLDADALFQTFDLVLNNGAPTSLFKRFSEERRRIFQTIIHPTSSANKLRLHGADAEAVVENDWYMQALIRGDPKELEALHYPLTHSWRTFMKGFVY